MKLILSLCWCLAFASLVHAELPRLIAHRGASHEAPENTLAAFRLAWEEGADGIEGDFYLTPDGEIVCIHDPTTKRVAGRELVVEETPWPELAKLDVGSWKSPRYKDERIPRLQEVLDLLPQDKWFFIEIKDGVEIVEPLLKILMEKRVDPKRVILISFHKEVVTACRRQIPEFEVHWLSSLKNIEQPGRAEAYRKELEELDVKGFQFSAAAPVAREWLEQVKRSGHVLDAWTVDDPARARTLIGYGVDFITTNRPGPLRTELLSTARAWNVRDHVAREDFIIQSHRGAGALSPENSRESFELAWKLGTLPEADLRTTKDGVIVAFHDNRFTRILADASEEMKNKRIEDFTWEEVSRLDIGRWKGESFQGQRVPSLAQICELLKEDPGRRMYIDIKNVDLAQLAREVHAAGVAPRLILASTRYDIIRTWKELAPDSFTLHWMGGEEAELGRRLQELEDKRFAAVDQLQIHIKPGKPGETLFAPSAEFVQRTGETLRRHGVLFQTLPWESRDPALFTRLLDLGVASFATDYPDFTAEVVRSYYEQPR